MFTKTIEEAKRLISDAKAFGYYATLITQCFFVVYYILALALSFGFAGVYATLLALTAAALVFFLFTETPKNFRNVKVHKTVRILIRYAKYCVHIVAISLTLYSLYVTEPSEISALSPILLIFAVLALLIQILGELVAFLAKNYVEVIVDTAVEESEFLRSVIGKVQGGIEAYKGAKERIAAIPSRAADAAHGIKSKLASFFHKKDEASTEEPLADEEETQTTIHS